MRKGFWTVVAYIAIGLLSVSSGLMLIWLYQAFFEFKVSLLLGPATDVWGMNLLAVVYFVGNTLVALVAPAVLFLGMRQFGHSENTRRASVYLEVSRRYNEDATRYSRARLFMLKEQYESAKPPGISLGQFCHKKLVSLFLIEKAERLAGTVKIPSEYSRYMALLSFLEDLGVLVDRGYLVSDDLFDLMCSTIIQTEEILRDHMIWLRAQSKSSKLFANALSLMDKASARHDKLNSFNKGVYKIPR